MTYKGIDPNKRSFLYNNFLDSFLVLSPDKTRRRSGTVIAIAITSQLQRAGFPLTLELESTGLLKRSWVKTNQIRTLSVERIGKKISKADHEELSKFIEGLNEIIGN